MNYIQRCKTHYDWHVKRRDSCLEKDTVQEYVGERRATGRQRRRWIKDITEWTWLQINEYAQITEDTINTLLATNPPERQY